MTAPNSYAVRLGGALVLSFGLAASGANAEQAKKPIQTGLASWYGEEVAIGEKNGQLIYRDTASGDPFDPNVISAAHMTLPLETCVLVKTDKKSLKVIINDRGPAEWTGKIIDISRKGAEVLGFKEAGKARVELHHC